MFGVFWISENMVGTVQPQLKVPNVADKPNDWGPSEGFVMLENQLQNVPYALFSKMRGFEGLQIGHATIMLDPMRGASKKVVYSILFSMRQTGNHFVWWMENPLQIPYLVPDGGSISRGIY